MTHGRVGGKTALVTGGARGMGAAHARLLAAHGARVVIADVLDDEAEALATDIGAAATAVHLDVTSAEQWDDAVRVTAGTFGSLDILVNNAGILLAKPLEDTTEAEYRRVIDVDQVGLFLGMRAVVRPMRAAGGGSIVNISSTAGIVGFPDCFAYTAAKWAVRGMTKAAALELAPYGIRVNSVHPGDVETPMTRSVSSGAVTTDDAIPLRRWGRSEEIAHLVLYLASNESSYTTGAEHVIDGGYTAL